MAAERAYEAVAERPGVTVDAKRDERARPASSGRTTATAREEEDTSMSVVRSFSFARDEVDGDDGDVGDADADEDEPSREAFEDDGGAYDQKDAAGFIKIQALRLRTLGSQRGPPEM